MLVPDWGAIGTALAAIVIGVGSFIGGRAKRGVITAKEVAETDVITLMRAEVLRLSNRVTALESREGRLIRHVYRLEGLMTGNGMTPPRFDIDGDAIGTVANPT